MKTVIYKRYLEQTFNIAYVFSVSPVALKYIFPCLNSKGVIVNNHENIFNNHTRVINELE